VQLVSKISNLCGPDPPTSDRRTDRQTDDLRRYGCLLTCHVMQQPTTRGQRRTLRSSVKRPSMHSLEPSSFSIPSRWNRWHQCTSRRDSFLSTSVARSQLVQGMTAKAAFCFSTFQFCCTTVLFLFTARIECHSICNSF